MLEHVSQLYEWLRSLLTAGADALVGLAVLAETAVLWINVRQGNSLKVFKVEPYQWACNQTC
jgi:hypothetical protein